MKIRVDKFRTSLALLQPVVPKNPTLKVIANVLAKDGQLTATDLENTVTIALPEARDALLLPYRALMELLKYVPGDEMLTLELNGKNLKLSWKGGSAAYDVEEVQDYPELNQTPEFLAEGDLNGDLLVEALLAALPYCATETSRPVLNGVTVYLGNVIQVAGADGFRLSYQSLALSYPVQQTLILPADTVKVLEHLWHKSPAVVGLESSLVRQLMAVRNLKLSLGEGIVDFQFGNLRLRVKPIAGTPPDHLALLNNFHEPIKVKLLAPELRNAVRRLKGIAKDGTGIVRLQWTESAMTVSAQSLERGQVSAEIPVQPESQPGRTALNVKYLLEYLEGKEGVVTLGKESVSSPALFHYGSKPIVAIMPMQVQWDDEKPESGEASTEAAEGEAETTAENQEAEIKEEAEGESEKQEEESPGETHREPVASLAAAEATPAEQPPTEAKAGKPEKRRSRRKKT